MTQITLPLPSEKPQGTKYQKLDLGDFPLAYLPPEQSEITITDIEPHNTDFYLTYLDADFTPIASTIKLPLDQSQQTTIQDSEPKITIDHTEQAAAPVPYSATPNIAPYIFLLLAISLVILLILRRAKSRYLARPSSNTKKHNKLNKTKPRK